jgi:hypothetical protein
MHWLHGTTGQKESGYAGQSTWYLYLFSILVLLVTVTTSDMFYFPFDLFVLGEGNSFKFLFFSFPHLYLGQFFASDERIKAVRQMIMAPTVELRQQALDRLLPYQRSDFEGIFRAMDGTWKKKSQCLRIF